SALENVMLPAFMAGVSRKEALERAKELLADVGLEHRLHHFPSQLSGGERQRAAVARALVNRPALMLADEPTGNLDPANALMIQDVLFSAADRHNASLIIVTHDPAMASRADHLYRLQEGRLVRS
ncbi:MAG TPA: ATP-binding cassette domain-containing protein, partial [Treponemataceae bacterium]|nr:ATP-binding cassette domain-containing protein [Treponemataceae bacterium]